ncbi:MAG: response regulator [Candidatus Eisenbacteria bacterium]
MDDPNGRSAAGRVKAGGSFHALKDLRVLVVDDEPLIRVMVRATLRRFGSVAEVASSAEDALYLLEHEPFDLLITDIEMSGMDGVELARTVRDPTSSVLRHDLPIIVITALEGDEVRARCREVGTDEFLSKPIRAKELLQAVRRQAGGRR